MSDGMHHLHARKRIYERLEQFPHPDSFKGALDHIMIGVALASPLVLVPQVVQLYTTQDASGLSIQTYVLLLMINTLWTLYSSLHREWPLLIACSLMGVQDMIIVIGILMFR